MTLAGSRTDSSCTDSSCTDSSGTDSSGAKILGLGGFRVEHLQALAPENLAASLKHNRTVDAHGARRDKFGRDLPGHARERGQSAIYPLAGQGCGHYGNHR
jgi:hypothetical protein